MYAWIAVAAGGAIGSVARHGVNRLVHQAWPSMRFPLATVVVNIAGCGIIGMLAGLIATSRLPMRANWREFIFVGILGGFTTFSSYMLDSFTLAHGGEHALAISNIVVQTAAGFLAVWAGYRGVILIAG